MMTRSELEERRLAGREMFLAGASQSAVAKALAVTRTTASRWARQTKYGADMRKRKPTGRPSRLSPEQVLALHAVWETRLRWTTGTFAEAIRQTTGVKYDPDHVGRLILRMGLRKKQARRVRRPAAAMEELALA